MNHYTSPRFWDCYAKLSAEQQELADKAYELLKANPSHPSLHFKKVGRFWSARVSYSLRALAVEVSEGYLWFWVGPHDEYDRLVNG